MISQTFSGKDIHSNYTIALCLSYHWFLMVNQKGDETKKM